MKKGYILIVIVFLISYVPAAGQVHKYWINKAGGLGDHEGYGVSIDAHNNTYTTGYITGSATFGNIAVHTYGVTDVFISKSDTAGNFLWVVHAGGPNVDKGLAIRADSSGNVFVTGFFTGVAYFGSTTITSAGFQDMFVAKYNTNGNLQWVRSAGGPQNDAGNGIAVDRQGNVIVTGQFIGIAHFGAFTLTSQNDPITSIPSIDIFTVKYDSSGNVMWAKRGSSIYIDRGLDVATDHSGNIYVTGQFSDTVMFDQIHNNYIYNAIFLMKYDSNGNEQWFRSMGGSQNTAYGISINDTSGIFLTGDFRGTLYFLDSTSAIASLSNPHHHKIFIARYDWNGNLVWSHADGSDNDVSSRDIALDDSSNIYIVGTFNCRFSENADRYGQGMFNSDGYKDVFVSKYSSSGTWQWSKNFGGQFNDDGRGIAVNHYAQPIITGGFINRFIVPYTNHFIPPPPLPPGYWLGYTYTNNCADTITGFRELISSGNKNIFICNACDPKAKPFYYYNDLHDTACQRNSLGICISGTPTDDQCGNDTIVFCGYGAIYANTQTSNIASQSQQSSSSPGPQFNYVWSTGATSKSITVSSSGTYSVTATSIDGCFSSSSQIYVRVKPVPPKPIITDSKGININSPYPNAITLCRPDSVLLIVTNAGNDSITWTGITPVSHNDTVSISTSSYNHNVHNIYLDVTLTNSSGCTSAITNILLRVDSIAPPPDTLPVIVPAFIPTIPDSFRICLGGSLTMTIYDTISGNSDYPNCNFFTYTGFIWNSYPSLFRSFLCSSIITFYPVYSGSYLVTCHIDRALTTTTFSLCGGGGTTPGVDTFFISKQIYVSVDSVPSQVPLTISGSPSICPGDTVTLTCSPGSSYSWHYNNYIVGRRDTSFIRVTGPGYYTVVVSYSAGNGCSTNEVASFVLPLQSPPTIMLVPSDGLICPNDSVQLSVSDTGIYQWQGPIGPVGGNTASVFASVPGYYYCTVTSGNCTLVSDAAEVLQYSTPSLFITPTIVICPGQSVELDISTNINSTIVWGAPIGGGSLSQTISNPGTYTCSITSCGILTQVTATLLPSNVSASVTPSGNVHLCAGDSVMLTANSGMAMYNGVPGDFFDPVLSVSQAGIYSLITMDGYGCMDTSAPVTVVIDSGIPPPVISSNTPVCAGDSLRLFSSPVPGVTYSWSGPNGFSSTLANPVLSSISTGDSGIYTLTITPFNNCSNSAQEHVVIDSTPAVPILTSNVPLCMGDTLFLFSNAAAGAGYVWSGPLGFNAITPNATLANISFLNSGNYSLLVSYGNGCADSSSIAITVDSSLSPPAISSNSPLCSGDTLVLNSNAVPGVTYFWTGPNSFNSSFQNPVIQNCPVTNGDIYTLTITAVSGCLSTSSTTVVVDSTPALLLSSNSPVCSGDTLRLYCTGVTGASCNWTGPNGFSSVLANPSLPHATVQDSGYYHLTGMAANGCTGISALHVFIDTMPEIKIQVSSPVCLDSLVVLSATGYNGVSYLWTVPGGSVFYSDHLILQPFHEQDTGYYYLTATDGICSAEDSADIFPDCLPFIPNVFTPNGDGVNDYFELFNFNFEKINCRIFNRWGQLIYEWTDRAGRWDGTDAGNNRSAPSGVYYYVLEFKGYNQVAKTIHGTVELIRD